MSWWSLLPDVFALAGLVLVPGALALRLLGVRGLAALAAAAPVTLAGVGVLTVGYAPLGIPWRLPAVAAGLVLLLLVLAVIRRFAGWGAEVAGPKPGPLSRHETVAVAAAVTAGVALLAAPFVVTIPTPDAPLQQWDAVFHLNAVVAVRETGVATPLGGLTPLYGNGALAPYYPTGWHALVALAPGSSVPAVTNAGLLVLGIVVWVVGLTGLAREVFHLMLPTVLAPLLAAGFVAYPVVQLTVLAQFPNGLSTALLPGALLLLLRAVRAVRSRAAVAPAVAAAVAGGVGVAVAHPSGLFSLAVLAGPLLGAAVGGWSVRVARSGRRLLGGGVLVVLAASALGLPVFLANHDALSSVVGFDRASGRSHLSALLEVLLDQTLVYSYGADGWQHLAVTGATLAGAVLTFVRRRHRWLAAGWALAVALAVLASGPEDHPLRWLAAFWYTQAGRIAPVAVVPAVLLAAYALTEMVDRVRASSDLRRNLRRAADREWAAGRAVIVGVLAVVLITAGVRLPVQRQVVASAYVPGELAWGTMATAEELAMMRRLGDVLPRDAVVVGDPFNGSALLPAVASVDVVFPQLGASGLSPAHRLLQDGLAEVHHDPAVCDALNDVGATHVYHDTATADDGAKINERTQGMRELDVSRGFAEVASAGEATVYRIEAC